LPSDNTRNSTSGKRTAQRAYHPEKIGRERANQNGTTDFKAHTSDIPNQKGHYYFNRVIPPLPNTKVPDKVINMMGTLT
jgi:hypothetical protein